jgi:hypothetical protein
MLLQISHFTPLNIHDYIGGLPPLPTESSWFCKMIFLAKNKKHMKNGENILKEQNESFQMVHGLPK